jgi:HAD superfamily hydrolase (TIGR01459 family)
MALRLMTPLHFTNGLRHLVEGVDIVLSDVWGVLHDGLTAFPDACEALIAVRRRGGKVILITNAPRPADSVQRQLRKLGVPDDVYDGIVSSGDLTRNYVAARPAKTVYAIGPSRDGPIYRGLDVRFAALENADYIVCTGPFDDDVETAEDYRDAMMQARARNLTFVCANPDIVVERGDRLIVCAGAIAELYRSLGGDVIFFGKPHLPIYRQAIALAEGTGSEASTAGNDDSWRGRVLAIGDSVRTDVAGAHAAGVPCVFLTRGIHAEEFAGIDRDDAAAVGRLFGATPAPRALMHELKW